MLSFIVIGIASGMKAATELSLIEVNGWLYILIFIMTLVCALMLVSMWRIFVKTKNKGWKSLIPVYNYIVELEFLDLPIWMIVLFFIPVANIAFVIITSIKMAKRFGKDGKFATGLILLPAVFYPILAFGDAKYK